MFFLRVVDKGIPAGALLGHVVIFLFMLEENRLASFRLTLCPLFDEIEVLFAIY